MAEAIAEAMAEKEVKAMPMVVVTAVEMAVGMAAEAMPETAMVEVTAAAEVEVVKALETGRAWTPRPCPCHEDELHSTMLGSCRMYIKRNRQRRRRSIAAV